MLQGLQGRRGLTQGSTTGEVLLRLRWMQPGVSLRANNGSWGAQLPLKQLTLLLLLFCCFLGFFLRCHVDLLTSYVVGFSCKQHLLLHSQIADHVVAVTLVSFPKQDYDAWCANSKLRSKKNATLL